MNVRSSALSVGLLVAATMVAGLVADTAATADDLLAQGLLPGTFGMRFAPDGNLFGPVGSGPIEVFAELVLVRRNRDHRIVDRVKTTLEEVKP